MKTVCIILFFLTVLNRVNAQEKFFAETRYELNGVQQHVSERLFAVAEKYDNMVIKWGICTIVPEKDSGVGQSRLVLKDIMKPLNYKYDRIILERQPDKDLITALMYYNPDSSVQGLSHVPHSSDLYVLLLDLDRYVSRIAYIDISDIAREYHITHIWQYVYEKIQEKQGFQVDFSMQFGNIGIRLDKTMQSSLPDNMYPIDFLKRIILKRENKKNIRIILKGDENENNLQNNWYLEIPFVEIKEAEALLPELIELLTELSLHSRQ